MSLISYLTGGKEKIIPEEKEELDIGVSTSLVNTYEPDSDIAVVHVEVTVRKIPKKKRFGIQRYDKIPVYRLVFHIAGSVSYEEYLSHKDLYKRLATQPIFDEKFFPNCIRINEFIDLGFSIMIV